MVIVSPSAISPSCVLHSSWPASAIRRLQAALRRAAASAPPRPSPLQPIILQTASPPRLRRPVPYPIHAPPAETSQSPLLADDDNVVRLGLIALHTLAGM